MGFKDFCNNKTSDKKIDEEILKQSTKNVEDLYNQYKDKNETELLQELYNSVQKQKQNGTYDYEKLAAIIEQFSSVLNNEQIERMKEILKTI